MKFQRTGALLALALGAATVAGAVLATAPAGASTQRALAPGRSAHGSGRICGDTACIYAYVDGSVQDGNLNWSGTVKTDPAGTKVSRLELDGVVLASYGQPGARLAGAQNYGSTAPITASGSTRYTGCEPVRLEVQASGRGADGSLVRGSIYTDAFVTDSASCPGAALSGHGVTQRFTANAQFPTKIYLGRSVDGRTPYAWGEIVAHHQNDVTSVQVDRVIVTVDGALLSASTRGNNSGPIAGSGDTDVVAVASGHPWTAGCHDYVASVRFSARLADGELRTVTLSTPAHRYCT